jgi:hypothetical protein
MGFWEALYQTIRLFMFDGPDPFPKSAPLIVLFFLAPAIAISLAGTIIGYLFKISPGLKVRFQSGHVIVCGVGRTGKLIAASLKKRGVPVVGLDLGPAEDFEEWREESRVPMLFGDFRGKALLKRAGAERARSIVFASGNDLVNLDASIGLYDWLRDGQDTVRLIWTHIANEGLAETARHIIETEGKLGIRFFDTYHIAATRVIARHFPRERREGVHEVVILGFGKFGRDLFEALVVSLGPEEKIRLHVIDIRDHESEVRTLAGELKVDGRTTFSRADIHDLFFGDERDKVFFLCTDDDLGNLTAAMTLAARGCCGHIYVRMAQWPLSAVADRLGENEGVTFVNINELMLQGVAELPGIFAPAKAADLKRVKTS